MCGALFKHFIVEFDFDKLDYHFAQAGDLPVQGSGSPVKMSRDEGGGYAIPVKIKMRNKAEIDYSLSIDLGGIDPVALVISDRQGIDKPATEKVYLGHGASGEITGYRDVLESLTVGDYEIHEVLSVFTESDDEGDHTNTTIGLPLLMHFNLVFDYFNETLYLEPNSHIDDAFEKPMD